MAELPKSAQRHTLVPQRLPQSAVLMRSSRYSPQPALTSCAPSQTHAPTGTAAPQNSSHVERPLENTVALRSLSSAHMIVPSVDGWAASRAASVSRQAMDRIAIVRRATPGRPLTPSEREASQHLNAVLLRDVGVSERLLTKHRSHKQLPTYSNSITCLSEETYINARKSE